MPAVASDHSADMDSHSAGLSAMKMAEAADTQNLNGFNHPQTPMEIYHETVSALQYYAIHELFECESRLNLKRKVCFGNFRIAQTVVAGLPSWLRMQL